MTSSTQRRIALIGASVVALAAWTVLYGWPIQAIVDRSITGVADRDGLTLETIGSVFSDRRIHRLLLLSVGQAVCSTVIVMGLGLPIAWTIARIEFVGPGTLPSNGKLIDDRR